MTDQLPVQKLPGLTPELCVSFRSDGVVIR